MRPILDPTKDDSKLNVVCNVTQNIIFLFEGFQPWENNQAEQPPLVVPNCLLNF